jgi:hypothetical protein
VVLITDAPPSGFCNAPENEDGEDGIFVPYEPSYTNNPHTYALEASTNHIHINAIQISTDSYATPVMQDYSTTSCGWYSQLDDNSSSDDIETAILKMLYLPDECNQ